MTTPILPIASFKNQILQTIKSNPATIIVAETGAGKSTQVPKYLAEAGYSVVVTQPRRLAARSVATRVAQELGEEIGKTIGVRTRDDNVSSPDTKVLFCTDGLAMVRQIMGSQVKILVIDEVHEWNINIEILVAWAKEQIQLDSDFRVVLMSATMESQALSDFFDVAPIIEVPGRMFPVEIREGKSKIDSIEALVREGRNVLVFEPGKSEINATISSLKTIFKDSGPEILPLHGELTSEDQDRVFTSYQNGKVVVATNIAETSITIDDIDAVVDSGMEQRNEVVNGVEGLCLRPISMANAKQRRGRAGRTRPGIYMDFCPHFDRLDFPKAEIERIRLDQAALRLLESGIDMEKMNFFHQPPIEAIHGAYEMLKVLGCISDRQVTPIGRWVSKLPTSVRAARMIYEADKYGVVGDVVTLVSIMDEGGIAARKTKEGADISGRWQKHCTIDPASDLFSQFNLFKASETWDKKQLEDNGVLPRAFYRVKETRRAIIDLIQKMVDPKSSGDQSAIRKCLLAGSVDLLRKVENGAAYLAGGKDPRELSRESVLQHPKWVVGTPFNLEVPTWSGRKVLKFLTMCTQVQPSEVMEVSAPIISRGCEPRYDEDLDSCTSVERLLVGGHVISEQRVLDPKHEKAPSLFMEWVRYHLYKFPEAQAAWDSYIKTANRLKEKNPALDLLSAIHFDSEYWELGGNPASKKELDFDLLAPPSIPQRIIEETNRNCPDTIVVDGVALDVVYWSGNYKTPFVKVTFLPSEQPKLPTGKDVYLVTDGDIRSQRGASYSGTLEAVKKAMQDEKDEIDAERVLGVLIDEQKQAVQAFRAVCDMGEWDRYSLDGEDRAIVDGAYQTADRIRYNSQSTSIDVLREETPNLFRAIDVMIKAQGAVEARKQKDLIDAGRKDDAQKYLAELMLLWDVCPVCGDRLTWEGEDINCLVNGYSPGHDCSLAAIEAAGEVDSGETIFRNNRTASVIQKITIDGKTAIQSYVYHKGGGWNYRIEADMDVVYRTGERKVQTLYRSSRTIQKPIPITAPTGPVSLDMLKAKWKGAQR